ncbi:MAG: hypothetical protein MHMPM18_002054 [Marteilia pararefringens]
MTKLKCSMIKKCDAAAADYKEDSLSSREPPEQQQDDETTPIMVVFGDSTHNNDLDAERQEVEDEEQELSQVPLTQMPAHNIHFKMFSPPPPRAGHHNQNHSSNIIELLKKNSKLFAKSNDEHVSLLHTPEGKRTGEKNVESPELLRYLLRISKNPKCFQTKRHEQSQAWRTSVLNSAARCRASRKVNKQCRSIGSGVKPAATQNNVKSTPTDSNSCSSSNQGQSVEFSNCNSHSDLLHLKQQDHVDIDADKNRDPLDAADWFTQLPEDLILSLDMPFDKETDSASTERHKSHDCESSTARATSAPSNDKDSQKPNNAMSRSQELNDDDYDLLTAQFVFNNNNDSLEIEDCFANSDGSHDNDSLAQILSDGIIWN